MAVIGIDVAQCVGLCAVGPLRKRGGGTAGAAQVTSQMWSENRFLIMGRGEGLGEWGVDENAAVEWGGARARGISTVSWRACVEAIAGMVGEDAAGGALSGGRVEVLRSWGASQTVRRHGIWESRTQPNKAVELRRALAKREVGGRVMMGRKDVPLAQRGARSAVARYCDALIDNPSTCTDGVISRPRCRCASGCLRSLEVSRSGSKGGTDLVHKGRALGLEARCIGEGHGEKETGGEGRAFLSVPALALPDCPDHHERTRPDIGTMRFIKPKDEAVGRVSQKKTGKQELQEKRPAGTKWKMQTRETASAECLDCVILGCKGKVKNNLRSRKARWRVSVVGRSAVARDYGLPSILLAGKASSALKKPQRSRGSSNRSKRNSRVLAPWWRVDDGSKSSLIGGPTKTLFLVGVSGATYNSCAQSSSFATVNEGVWEPGFPVRSTHDSTGSLKHFIPVSQFEWLLNACPEITAQLSEPFKKSLHLALSKLCARDGQVASRGVKSRLHLFALSCLLAHSQFAFWLHFPSCTVDSRSRIRIDLLNKINPHCAADGPVRERNILSTDIPLGYRMQVSGPEWKSLSIIHAVICILVLLDQIVTNRLAIPFIRMTEPRQSQDPVYIGWFHKLQITNVDILTPRSFISIRFPYVPLRPMEVRPGVAHKNSPKNIDPTVLWFRTRASLLASTADLGSTAEALNRKNWLNTPSTRYHQATRVATYCVSSADNLFMGRIYMRQSFAHRRSARTTPGGNREEELKVGGFCIFFTRLFPPALHRLSPPYLAGPKRGSSYVSTLQCSRLTDSASFPNPTLSAYQGGRTMEARPHRRNDLKFARECDNRHLRMRKHMYFSYPGVQGAEFMCQTTTMEEPWHGSSGCAPTSCFLSAAATTAAMVLPRSDTNVLRADQYPVLDSAPAHFELAHTHFYRTHSPLLTPAHPSRPTSNSPPQQIQLTLVTLSLLPPPFLNPRPVYTLTTPFTALRGLLPASFESAQPPTPACTRPQSFGSPIPLALMPDDNPLSPPHYLHEVFRRTSTGAPSMCGSAHKRPAFSPSDVLQPDESVSRRRGQYSEETETGTRKLGCHLDAVQSRPTHLSYAVHGQRACTKLQVVTLVHKSPIVIQKREPRTIPETGHSMNPLASFPVTLAVISRVRGMANKGGGECMLWHIVPHPVWSIWVGIAVSNPFPVLFDLAHRLDSVTIEVHGIPREFPSRFHQASFDLTIISRPEPVFQSPIAVGDFGIREWHCSDLISTSHDLAEAKDFYHEVANSECAFTIGTDSTREESRESTHELSTSWGITLLHDSVQGGETVHIERVRMIATGQAIYHQMYESKIRAWLPALKWQGRKRRNPDHPRSIITLTAFVY
ncbi:hypothetical protein B0H14DRAFT_3729107 [Mycena olivaceomarginata]|nr:hypothetical protein B0H14DRAFT_3729107 [Mycena olivaceomarginata]